MLTREQIIGASLRTQSVAVEAWGGDVCIREMTVADRNEIMRMQDIKKKQYLIDVEMVIRCVCDEDGKRLFKTEDASVLKEKSREAIEGIAREISRMNKLDPGGEETAATEKNSASGRSGGSSSGSRSRSAKRSGS